MCVAGEEEKVGGGEEACTMARTIRISPADEGGAIVVQDTTAVSYTHLTLPTNAEV